MLCDNEYDKVTKHERLRVILYTFLYFLQEKPPLLNMESPTVAYGETPPRGGRRGAQRLQEWGGATSPSPARRATTGHEDYAQLEWLVEKMARELQESRQREARVLREVAVVSENTGVFQDTVTSLLRQNAYLRSQIAARVEEHGEEGASGGGGGVSGANAGEVPQMCRTALKDMTHWFDDRSELQETIEVQQKEIARLTSTVSTLTQLLQHTQR